MCTALASLSLNHSSQPVFSSFYFQRLKRQGAAHEQATALKDKGNAVYKTGKIEEALKIYQHGFALDGTSGVIASNICQCLLTLNRLDEAAEWAEKCIRLSPSKKSGNLQTSGAGDQDHSSLPFPFLFSLPQLGEKRGIVKEWWP